MINKDMLQYLISIGIKITEISKALNVGRTLVAPWIKFHKSSNVLREPEDDDEITQMLREVKKIHFNVGYRCIVGHLQTKEVKAKKVRLILILKNPKNYDPIKIDVIRR